MHFSPNYHINLNYNKHILKYYFSIFYQTTVVEMDMLGMGILDLLLSVGFLVYGISLYNRASKAHTMHTIEERTELIRVCICFSYSSSLCTLHSHIHLRMHLNIHIHTCTCTCTCVCICICMCARCVRMQRARFLFTIRKHSLCVCNPAVPMLNIAFNDFF